MVSSGSWRDHFKIDETIFKAFWAEFSENSPLRASELTLEKAPSTTEFVLWCVRERHFTEKDFIAYQSEHHSLPVIRPEFFATPIDQIFWDRVKELHPWTADCFPVAEWEGHLLIGTVWPIDHLPISSKHSFVLGTPTGLREFHEKFARPAPTAAPTVAPTPAPAPVKVPEPPRVEKSKPKVDDGDPFAALSRELGLSTEETEESADASSDESVQAPDGLFIPDGLKFSSEEIARLGGTDTTAPVVEANSEPIAESSEANVGSSENSDGSNVDFAASLVDTVVTSPGRPHASNEVASTEASPEPVTEIQDGTIVHNFETGGQEIAQRKPEPNLAAPATSVTATNIPASLFAPPPPPPAPVPAPPAIAEAKLETVQEADATQEEDPDKTQPSFKPPQSEPPVLEIDNAKAFEPASPARPVPEATIVVNASNEQDGAAKVRKPLFEPLSGSPAMPQTAVSDRLREMAASRTSGNTAGGATNGGTTNGGTQTGTKSKKLEAPPLTSFFGVLGKTPSGRVRNELYTKHAIAISRMDPVHLDECVSIDEAGAQALLQAANIFETSMILLFKEDKLYPWKWSDLFLSIHGEKPEPIDLTEPSIFKIVFRTAKPYHGYVVTSATNQKFFNEFYRGMLPKHATVIPIIIDGRMGGMLLAFTNSKIEYRQSLRLMERLGFDLARVFKTLRGNISKAS